MRLTVLSPRSPLLPKELIMNISQLSKRSELSIALLVGATVCFPISAKAATITSLYNTGVDNSGTVLANGTVGDPHYLLASVPSASPTAIRVLTSANGYPIGPWLGDNTTSRWIAPNSDSQVNGPVGNYTYRTTFDLTGFTPSTAQITGLWSSDDGGVDIVLNSTHLGSFANTGSSGIFTSFTISSGFQSGINTLDFVINNSFGPTGLRTELSGTANLGSSTSVPEPFTVIGTLIGGTAALRMRKKLKSTSV